MSFDWAADLNKIAEKDAMNLGDLCRAVKIELFNETIDTTRVGNPSAWKSAPPPGYVGGRLRGNWQIQENEPAEGVLVRIDKTGEKAKKDAEKASEDGLTYFTNNLPYAIVWELEDGMVANAVARVGQILKDKAREY